MTVQALTTISGNTVVVDPARQPQIVDAIGQRSTCTFGVLDYQGMAHYRERQPVFIFDEANVCRFAGVIQDAKRQPPSAISSQMVHDISCMDWHYLADKRTIATSYASQTCGFIIADIIANWLKNDGVFAVLNLLSVNQSNVETNTTGFTAITGATLTRITTQHWEGTASLQVACPGVATNEGFGAAIADTNFISGEAVIGSVYLRGSGTVILKLVDFGVAQFAASAPITLTTTWTRYSLVGVMPTLVGGHTYGLQVTTNSIQAVTFDADGLQLEPVPNGTFYATTVGPSPWEVGQTSSVQAGPLLTTYTANYQSVSSILDDMAKYAAFYWYINRARRLVFAALATTPAPFTFDGTIGIDGTGQVEDTSPLYRNAQYILGGLDVTSPQTETSKGDGSKRVFPTSFPIHQVPSNIHVNAGAAQTIGILGVDAAGTKQWYWNKGIAQVTQDSTGTVLATTDVLSVTYVGEFPIVVYANDSVSQSAELAREAMPGAVNSGINEDVQADASLTTATQAFQSAAALLGKYTVNGQILTFWTSTYGFMPGQALTVNLPTNWDYHGVTALIESVTSVFDDFIWWYDVKALLGPANTSWVQFYQALGTNQDVIDLSSAGGQSGIVALLATFTMAWTWAMSYTPTVFACPICGPATLCGASTICC